jgi:hypothetical protein
MRKGSRKRDPNVVALSYWLLAFSLEPVSAFISQVRDESGYMATSLTISVGVLAKSQELIAKSSRQRVCHDVLS